MPGKARERDPDGAQAGIDGCPGWLGLLEESHGPSGERVCGPCTRERRDEKRVRFGPDRAGTSPSIRPAGAADLRRGTSAELFPGASEVISLLGILVLVSRPTQDLLQQQ